MNEIEKFPTLPPLETQIISESEMYRMSTQLRAQRVLEEVHHSRGPNPLREQVGIPANHVISTISSTPLYSEGYYNCTALVLGGNGPHGQDSEYLLTHQGPNILQLDKSYFQRNIQKRVAQLLERIDVQTLRGGIVGGNCFYGGFDFDQGFVQGYEASIKQLKKLCEDTLQMTPQVLCGPNSRPNNPTSILVFPEKDQVLLSREGQLHPRNDEPFCSSQITEKITQFTGKIEKKSELRRAS